MEHTHTHVCMLTCVYLDAHIEDIPSSSNQSITRHGWSSDSSYAPSYSVSVSDGNMDIALPAPNTDSAMRDATLAMVSPNSPSSAPSIKRGCGQPRYAPFSTA